MAPSNVNIDSPCPLDIYIYPSAALAILLWKYTGSTRSPLSLYLESLSGSESENIKWCGRLYIYETYIIETKQQHTYPSPDTHTTCPANSRVTTLHPPWVQTISVLCMSIPQRHDHNGTVVYK